jgi:type I restriction enzyme M protein
LEASRVRPDESLEESDNLPDPDVLTQEIVEDLEAALEQSREIAVDIRDDSVSEQDPQIIE